MSATSPVLVGVRPLTLDDVVAVADGARVALAPEAIARVRAARGVVDALVGGDALIYGLNTGLGHLRDVRMPVEALRDYQIAIVGSHTGAVGPPLPRRVVRAAMFARLAGIAAGGAGGSPALVELLAAMLDAGVTPVVPTVGSIGASDLMHLAAVALVLIGEGQAEVDGTVLPGGQALAQVGLAPMTLEPKDGLVAISANAVAVGHAALVAERARWLARLADVVFVVSLEAVGGNPSIVDPVVAAAKRLAGQVEAADRIRALLVGSDRCRPGAAMSVQDPLSFRVAPQVHGAYRTAIDQLVWATELELNAMTDNPLVDTAGQRIVSNGNFAPMVLALAADALRPALGHVGLIADRRHGHLFDRTASDPRFVTVEGLSQAADLGGALIRYTSAARLTELRALADPVSLDVPPVDLGVEDHAANAPLAVRRTEEALDIVEDLLTLELVAARFHLRLTGVAAGFGIATGVILAEVDAAVEALGAHPSAEDVRQAVRGLFRTRIVPAAESAANL